MQKELAPEIERGLISVAHVDGRTSISIKAERQFDSGTVEPVAAVQAVIARVAEALGRTTGPILVRGYADSMPLKPGAFPSNQELSAARAKAAAALIAAKLGQQQRVTSEGVGEADPIAPNDTEINRAKNRRIAIFVGPQT
jgi:type VI secretion system protein ImpK